MAPIIEVSDDVLNTLNPVVYTRREDLEIKNEKSESDSFIYVPSIKLYVAKERSHLGENWFESHKKLQERGERMLTFPEFVEVLKYTKSNFPKIYNNITEVRNPWRAEWIDADFKVEGKKLYVNSNHVFEGDKLVPKKKRILTKNTLMEDKTPGISLEAWLENPTAQGFPRKNIEKGSLYYWHPRSYNNSVARFGAYSDWALLDCLRYPSYRISNLGVRAVRHE